MGKAAELANRAKPEITLCVLLVPNWTKGFSYTDARYLDTKNKFFSAIQAKIYENHLTDITLEDFYTDTLASNDSYLVVKEFLQGLTSRNKHSDLMKKHALIDERNSNCRHLQMDSNTQVHDYIGFYTNTFGNNDSNPFGVQLVASNYRSNFVCASNKVVFTTPNSQFVEFLRDKFFAYCNAIVAGEYTSKEKHSFYYNCFEPALAEIGAVRALQITENTDTIQKKNIYPATLDHPIYSLTKYVLVVVNLLWKDAAGVDKDISDQLKKFPEISIGDAVCGYASFLIAVRRLTDNLGLQKYAGNSVQYLATKDHANYADLSVDLVARRQFSELNNERVDLELIAKFYKKSILHILQITDRNLQNKLMQGLVASFPENELGNKTCVKLFGISLSDLQINPKVLPLKKWTQEIDSDIEEAPRVCIIGSGPAGLATAEQLSAAGIDYFVVEKGSNVGGLSTSFSVPSAHGEFTFDYTGHFLHLRNSYVKKRFQDDENLIAHQKRAAVYMRGSKSEQQLIPAPFQSNVHLFPEDLRDTITHEIENLSADEFSQSTNYGELERRKFGNTLGEISLTYNRKLYGREVDNLSPQQMARFSPRLNKQQLLDGCYGHVEQSSYNDTFLYTSSASSIHGMQAVSHNMYAKLQSKNFKFNAKVISIDLDKQQIWLSNGEIINYTHLVNTMPLPNLIKNISSSDVSALEKLNKQEEKLKAKPVKWVALGIQTSEFLNNNHWIYVPDADLPFYRIGCFSNIDPKTAPKGCSSVWVELNCDNELTDEESLAAISQFFKERGWIKSDADILFSEFKIINPAYVLMDDQYAETVTNIHETLASQNIFSIGRYGNWEYSSMGDAIEQGMKVADMLYNMIAKKQLSVEEEAQKRQYLAVNTQIRERLENILGSEFSQAAKDLESQGIVRLDGIFSPEELSDMQTEFAGWAATKPIDTQLHQQFDGVNKDESYLSMSFASSLAITHPVLFLLALHYWGQDMQLSSYRGIRTEPSDDERLKIRAYRWHNDGHGKMVKVMILLTDVQDDGQRMRFYPRTHLQDPLIRSSLDTLYSEDEVTQLKRSYINCSGPVGTVYIFNPEAIHAGTRNSSARRDILSLTFQAYPNVLTVPELQEDVATNLTNYEKRIFRVGTARKVVGGLFADASNSEYIETTKAREKQVKTALHDYQTMQDRYPDACSPINSTRFGLFIRDRQFYLPGFNYSESSASSAISSFKNDATKKRHVAYYLHDDLSGALLLPISPPPCTKDRIRDGALGSVREGLLKNNAEVERLITRIISYAENSGLSIDVNCNKSLANMICNLAKQVTACVDIITNQDLRQQLLSYLYLIESMEDCMQRITSYRERRTALMFVLGATSDIEKILNHFQPDCIGQDLEQIFGHIATAYVANLYMDPAAKCEQLDGINVSHMSNK